MFKAIFILSCVLLADAQTLLARPRVDYADNNVPTPYQFSYTAPADGGTSSHQETGDGNGRVQGSYTIEEDDGRSRVVEYVADEDGFRASISTNEPGTANQNPADVTIATSADDGYGGAQNPPTVVAAVTPANPPPLVRLSPRPAPPPARPALVPIQPALVPIQPAPALVPIEPTFFPPRFFGPNYSPLNTGGYPPRPALIPFDSRRFVAPPPALIPIEAPRFSIPDPFFGGSFFSPFNRK